MVRRLVSLLAFVLVTPAFAQEPDLVWIIRHVEDLPLDQVVRETTQIGGLEVEVEASLRGKRITLDLDATIVGALDAVARAAGGHLWKLGPRKYAIRSKPPPDSAKPPPEEFADPLDEEADPAPLPEWQQKIRKALEDTPYQGTFKDTPLPEFLDALAKQAGVPIVLDPHVLRSRTKKELRIEFWDALGNSSVGDALTLFCGFNDLCSFEDWGVVYVTTLKRLLAMKDRYLFAEGTEPGTEIATALEKHVVECRLSRAALKKALDTLAKGSGLKIAIDRATAKQCRTLKFDLRFAGQKFRDALSILLLPEGLHLEIRDGKLTVVLTK